MRSIRSLFPLLASGFLLIGACVDDTTRLGPGLEDPPDAGGQDRGSKPRGDAGRPDDAGLVEDLGQLARCPEAQGVVELSDQEFFFADIAADGRGIAFIETGGQLVVSNLPGGEPQRRDPDVAFAVFSQRGDALLIGFAPVTSGELGPVYSEVRAVHFPAQREERVLGNRVCGVYLSPNRRFVAMLDDCRPRTGALDQFSDARLSVFDLQGQHFEGGEVERVVAQIPHFSPDSKKLAYFAAPRPAACACSPRQYAPLRELELGLLSPNTLGDDLFPEALGYNPNGELLIQEEPLCRCSRELAIFRNGELHSLGAARVFISPALAVLRSSPDLWVAADPLASIGHSGVINALSNSAPPGGQAPVPPPPQNILQLVPYDPGAPRIDLAFDAGLGVQVSSLTYHALLGSLGDEWLVYADELGLLGQVEVVDPMHTKFSVSNQPPFGGFRISRDRSSLVFWIDALTQVPRVDLFAGRLGRVEAIVRGLELPNVHGFTGNGHSLIFGGNGRLQGIRLDNGTGPVDIDEYTGGDGRVVGDDSGCWISYNVARGARIRRLPEPLR